MDATGALCDIFATLDAGHFQRCFVAWVAALTGAPAEVIAIDGKTARRSHHKSAGKAALHMVSAFAARQRLVLGQVQVAEKANEIVAIPKLLDMLSIEGAIVTIDAMGCQRDIATAILAKKADYVLALKGNQGSLRQDVELFVTEQKERGFQDTRISQHRTVDGDHGRIETRTTTVMGNSGANRSSNSFISSSSRLGGGGWSPLLTLRQAGAERVRQRKAGAAVARAAPG